MKTVFLHDGGVYKITTDEQVDVQPVLPPACYTISQDQFGNYFFNTIDSYQLPKKIYGDTTKQADRIIKTFLDRPATTGVLLSGEKGSGKTLLAKALSVELAKIGIPTIVLNSPWCGEGFNKLIQKITQPAMILIDEYEKVYDSNQQQEMLTLLDGTFPTKKLFVLTVNDPYAVNHHMKNRPGRIYYFLDYAGVTAEFVKDYAQDNLKNQTHVDSLVRLSNLFTTFNFDMLKAVVEEMNRYDESPKDAIKILNTRPQNSDEGSYDVFVWKNNVPVSEYMPKTLEYALGMYDTRVVVPIDSTKKIIDENETLSAIFDAVSADAPLKPKKKPQYDIIILNEENMARVDPSIGSFCFVKGEYRVILRRSVRSMDRWTDAF